MCINMCVCACEYGTGESAGRKREDDTREKNRKERQKVKSEVGDGYITWCMHIKHT